MLVSILEIKLLSTHKFCSKISRIAHFSKEPRMDHHLEKPSSESHGASTRERERAGTPIFDPTHPVLSRLLEEVRNEKRVDAAYDRVHHRHNRGR